jgi:cell division protein FtsA
MESAGTRIENSIHCLRTLGVAVEALVHAPVASAEAVLDPNLKNLGALVIDMGGGSTDYAVYAGGALRQNGCVMFGSQNIREDFACKLRLPYASGERLLIEEGSVRLGQAPSGERLVVEAGPGSIPREIESETLNTIVHHRVRRALRSVKIDLQCSGLPFDSLRAGVHLTGGCSLLPGICELAEEVFGIPAGRARVTGISAVATILENPRHSCALGLATLAAGIEA